MGQKHGGVDSRGRKLGDVCGCLEILTKFFTGSSSPFDDLPEDCFDNIMSFITPRDAYVASLVSKDFRLRFSSDSIWEKFLPPDYASLIPKSRVFSSKKEIYVALCDPILIHDGKKSFWLDKTSGKKCIMLSAKVLRISEGANPYCWKWISIPESRFEQIPELLNIGDLEIGGGMDNRILSPGTHYSAYVVYSKRFQHYGLRDLPIQVGVGFKGQEMPKEFVCFAEDTIKKWPERKIMYSKKRKDGWMEAKMGEFFNEGGLMGFDEIEVSIVDVARRPNAKRGLIIEGIEFRPTNSR